MSTRRSAFRLIRQFSAFFGMGLAAAAVHFGLLIGLVELLRVPAVPATLSGYLAGGIVSYLLNRTFTYDAQRDHVQAGWRFAVVAAIGFGLTFLLMSLLHGRFGWHYLPAQIITTGIVLVWSFHAHKYWSFGEK